MLGLLNVTKKYDEYTAVENVSLTVEDGEVFGLLGPNGAGKSTIISMISTVKSPTKGKIRVNGHLLSKEPLEAKKVMGVVPQDIALYEALSTKENLVFFGTLYGLSRSEIKKRMVEVLDIIELTDKQNQPVSEFSGGMKRRANLGVALMNDPKLLLLDEPTVGIDPQSRNHILETLKRLNQDKGITVIYISHYMEEIEFLCKKIAIIDHGRLIALGTKEALKESLNVRDILSLTIDSASLPVLDSIKQITGVSNITGNGRQISLLVDPQQRNALDIKLLSKSKVFYLKLILFPVVLILILGNMFGNYDTRPAQFAVAFYSEDTTVTTDSSQVNLGDSLYEKVLSSSDVKDLFQVKRVSSLSEGKNLVKQKGAAVVIYVPADFTAAYINDTGSSIQLIADNSKLTDKGIVQSILNRYEQSLTMLRAEENAVRNHATNSINPQKLQELLKNISNTQDSLNGLDVISTGSSTKPLQIMQYESIAMTVMFSILTAFELAHGLVEERLNHTQMRIRSTPTRNIQYAIGKVCSIILAIVVQMFIVMIISHFIFQIDFGNVLLILLTTVSYGFSFLGGSLVDRGSLPGGLQKLQQIIPNGRALNCYLKIYQGKTLSGIWDNLCALFGIGFIFLIIALYLFSGRRSSDHANINNNKKPVKIAVL